MSAPPQPQHDAPSPLPPANGDLDDRLYTLLRVLRIVSHAGHVDEVGKAVGAGLCRGIWADDELLSYAARARTGIPRRLFDSEY